MITIEYTIKGKITCDEESYEDGYNNEGNEKDWSNLSSQEKVDLILTQEKDNGYEAIVDDICNKEGGSVVDNEHTTIELSITV